MYQRQLLIVTRCLTGQVLALNLHMGWVAGNKADGVGSMLVSALCATAVCPGVAQSAWLPSADLKLLCMSVCICSSGNLCELDAIWSKKAELNSSFNGKRHNNNSPMMQAAARDRVFDLTGRTGVFEVQQLCCTEFCACVVVITAHSHPQEL
jgi:hypothetical protein